MTLKTHTNTTYKFLEKIRVQSVHPTAPPTALSYQGLLNGMYFAGPLKILAE